ncbi:hypothetical protein HNP32_003472 [Brevundimonas bullata]|uniref:Uncharacterized protein n=1 Tax=Brevundimonas bullata TaxID=13160 RepID=A0A7W7N5Y2_9CAUL|nr:hypothetical protein [Brevundimonas bullata]MBB4799712.1 hypothetical protein [Brevundimonas bullata]MBB6384666.1 hypothetical protein [Brevundimonas bullata]
MSAANDSTPTRRVRLEGAADIASYLGRPERWVYHAREKGWSCPIRKRDGIGLYAFPDELDAWLEADETLAPNVRVA